MILRNKQNKNKQSSFLLKRSNKRILILKMTNLYIVAKTQNFYSSVMDITYTSHAYGLCRKLQPREL